MDFTPAGSWELLHAACWNIEQDHVVMPRASLWQGMFVGLYCPKLAITKLSENRVKLWYGRLNYKVLLTINFTFVFYNHHLSIFQLPAPV